MKTAVITGASRGIGAATARLFAKQGYRVAVIYSTSEAQAENVCQEIRLAGGIAEKFCCDVTDGAAVRRTASNVLYMFGSVDVLVNNAGIAQQKLFTSITEEDWVRMTDVHMKGAFLFSKAFVPHFIERHCGSIVNVSSIWGQTGGSCEVHYSAAKAGLIGFTKALAKEMSLSGIRVNCVCPGVIDTQMNACFDAETRRELQNDIPLGRFGTPTEVAEAIFYLAEAKYVTGQILGVNGGYYV